jgi:hypothetical protein
MSASAPSPHRSSRDTTSGRGSAELTPILQLRRAAIARRYAAPIEALYPGKWLPDDSVVLADVPLLLPRQGAKTTAKLRHDDGQHVEVRAT